MHTPRDHHERDRIGAVRTARLFSNIVSPPVIFAVLGLLLSLTAAGLWPGLAWAAVYGFMLSLLPILFVLWLLRSGRIVELHMSVTRERNLPYFFAVICAALTYGPVVALDGPELVRCLIIFNGVTLAALAIINVVWLISFHATAISAAWLIIALVYGWLTSLLVVPFVVLVIAVRLFLRRHTPAQVVGGMVMGVGSVWLVAQLGCF